MLRLAHNNKTTQAPREGNYLYRRNSERVIAGVCAGIAKYFDADALVIRLLALLICGATWGLGGLAYLVLWRKMPLIASDSGVYDISIPESKHVLQLHIPFYEIAFAWLFLLSLGILSGISFSIHHALPLYSFLPALLFVFALGAAVLAAYSNHVYVLLSIMCSFISLGVALLPFSLGAYSNANTFSISAFIVGIGVVFAVALLGVVYRNDGLLIAANALVIMYCIFVSVMVYPLSNFGFVADDPVVYQMSHIIDTVFYFVKFHISIRI